MTCWLFWARIDYFLVGLNSGLKIVNKVRRQFLTSIRVEYEMSRALLTSLKNIILQISESIENLINIWKGLLAYQVWAFFILSFNKFLILRTYKNFHPDHTAYFDFDPRKVGNLVSEIILLLPDLNAGHLNGSPSK